jgi:DNA-binding transcriptional MerR regulator
MAYRVEELAAKADISVDTVRYYQAKDLLPPPTRAGRVAWYDDEHLGRLTQIRRLQGRGFSLAVIRRLLNGELDHADEELVAALTSGAEVATGDGVATAPVTASASASASNDWLTLQELAAESGIPLPLLQAVEREGLLVPRRVAGEPRYTASDVTVAAAGLQLLEHGLPLPELLELARAHDAATRAIAERAVELFDQHIRHPLREAGLPDDTAAEQLVAAFEHLLPATLAIVGHHFRRTLLAVAQEHIERVGNDDERQAVAARAGQQLEEASWAG